MTVRILLWPWWARAVLFTCLCAGGAVVATGFAPIGDTVVRTVLLIGGISVGVGALATARSERAHRAYTAALDGLSAADRSAAITALRRGPLPEAPAVRAATTRVGEIYLEGAARSWSLIIVTAPILVLLFAVVAVAEVQAGEPVAAVPFGALAALLVAGTFWSWYTPRLVRRRLDSML